MPAMLARARTDVHEPVRGAHGVFVVLDDQHGVAQITQPGQRADQSFVIPLVQTDARLVENVHHTHQATADLRREADALCLATRKRVRAAFKRQVVQPDIHKEAEPLPDLLENRPGDHLVAHRQRLYPVIRPGCEPLRESQCLTDAQAGYLRDIPPRDRDAEALRLELRTLADGARLHGHIPLNLIAHEVRRCFRVSSLQVRKHALERGLEALSAMLHRDDLAVRAMQQDMKLVRREFPHRRTNGELVSLRHGVQHAAPVCSGVLSLPNPRHDRPLSDGQRRVRNDHLRVEYLPGAEPGALRTRAMRAVEAERAGLDLTHADPTVRTGVLLGEHHLLAANDAGND